MGKETRRPDGFELRGIETTFEIRESDDDGKVTLRGDAALYDSLSENLGGFREQIAQGAFDEADMADVRGLFNHDSNYVLGRTASGTMKVTATKRGLGYEIDMPLTQTIRDLVIEPIRRGDVSQSSFGFRVAPGGDDWNEDEDGVIIRTLKKIGRVFDVSPVTFPAYPDTKVAARALEQIEEARESRAHEYAKRRRQLDSLLRRADIAGRV